MDLDKWSDMCFFGTCIWIFWRKRVLGVSICVFCYHSILMDVFFMAGNISLKANQSLAGVCLDVDDRCFFLHV